MVKLLKSMKSMKSEKVVSTTLAVAMLLSLAPTAALAATDYQDNWAKKSIEKLLTAGIIEGDGQGMRPNATMSRAEFVTVVNKAGNLQSVKPLPEGMYKDVTPNKWYFESVVRAISDGYMVGDGVNFRPEDVITREEICVALVRLYNVPLDKSNSAPFKDASSISDWAKDAVTALTNMGLFKGYEDGTFGARNRVTRSEVFSVVDRVLTYREKVGELSSGKPVQDLDIFTKEDPKPIPDPSSKPSSKQSSTPPIESPSPPISSPTPISPKVTGVKVDSIPKGKSQIGVGETLILSALVDGVGMYSSEVIWSVTGNSDSQTSIDSTGRLYVSLTETAKTLIVTAASTADPSFSSQVKLSVLPSIGGILLSSTPSHNTGVKVGNSVNFSAIVQGTGVFDNTVTWSISGNSDNQTTISSTGTLTVAPNEMTPSINVTATSTADSSVTGSVYVQVNPIVSTVTLGTNKTVIDAGSDLPLTVSVQGSGNVSQNVAWQITGNTDAATRVENGVLHLGLGETAGHISLTASSVYDPSKSASIDNLTIVRRMFTLDGKNTVVYDRIKAQTSYNFTPLDQPTGLYLSPNESATVRNEGAQVVKVYIGTTNYDGSTMVKSLNPSETAIVSRPEGGLLYFGNENVGGESTVTVVSGGTPIPFFELGRHNKQDWNNLLSSYPTTYNAAELKGRRGFVTTSYERMNHFTEDTDPTLLIQKIDQMVDIEDAVSGLRVDGSEYAKWNPHMYHFAEDRTGGGWMWAGGNGTGYVTASLSALLDYNSFVTDGWGPWHEVGHEHQQSWGWSGLGEVTVNIYSLSVQRAFGNVSRLENDGVYPKVISYLNQANEAKDFNAIEDVWIKLALFWQLDLAFGDQFYPKLHQMWRTRSDDFGLVGKEQMFMYMASVVSNRNLIPFFEQWGLRPTADMRTKIESLAFPDLDKEIWKNRDSAPIVEYTLPEYVVPVVSPNGTQTIYMGQAVTDINNFDQWVSASMPVTILTANLTNMFPNPTGSVAIQVMDTGRNTNLVKIPAVITGSDSIVYQGISNWNIAGVTFNHNTKSLKVETSNRNGGIHSYFSTNYISLTVIDGVTGIEKYTASAVGTGNPSAFVDTLNGKQFEYGDKIVIYHQEPNSRLLVYDKQGEKFPAGERTQTFYITPNGLSRTPYIP